MKSLPFQSLPIHVFLSSLIFLFYNLTSSTPTGNETDHLSLLKFKAELTSDPLQITNSWNESIHFCNWEGITCSQRHQKRVVAINLRSRRLSGRLSPAIGNLSFLRVFLIHNNSFTGKIPQEIGRLWRLERLSLGNNSFSGEMPANISRCSNLQYLNVAGNNLVGKIPVEFQSLSNLQLIYLYSNNLTGEIPPYFGNFSGLRGISILGNNFHGSIPDTLGQLTKLEFLAFATNNLSGTIPFSIFNLSTINMIDLPENRIGGTLPPNLGLGVPRLGVFNIAKNQFTGSIPVSISNASQLGAIAINANRFSGKVPSFQGMKNLEWVALNQNLLGNGESNDLSFVSSLINCTKLRLLHLSDNNFGGVLPKIIGNFSNLWRFTVGDNPIHGNIPMEIGDLLNLEALFLGPNLFTGSIPNSIGNLQKLKVLSIAGNKLSGNIPSSFGNLTLLTELYLSVSNLQGSIPYSLANCQNLLVLFLSRNNLSGQIPKEVIGLSSLSIFLDISYNNLIGSLPSEVGSLDNLDSLDVSNNNLSGEIPISLGNCRSLRSLSLADNFFQGTIPPSLSSLGGIEVLDLSRNNLTGEIPKYFVNFLFLQNLNLSFNDFEGEVPVEGVFRNYTVVSVVGNSKLCGGVPELKFKLPKCTIKEAPKKNGVLRILKFIIPISVGILVLILVLLYIVAIKFRRIEEVSPSDFLRSDLLLLKISYEILHKATNGFSSTNLIGSGKFSSVYKGILDEYETAVAVKVINLDVRGGSNSFTAECEALRNIRHRNLVKILTSCSSVDFQGNEFKALVYEFMDNGSLEEWLHQNAGVDGENRNLTLVQRLDIAIDVGCALDYIHHQCQTPLVHCDLKPSNILLDSELVAHLGDFGLAKFVPKSSELTHSIAISQSSSIGIKGTIGYTAPEYGMGSDVSTYGDIYSYGILLLEIFTGKRPTDDMFKDGLDLHKFGKTKMNLPEQVVDIFDPALLQNEEDERETYSTRDDSHSRYFKNEGWLVSIFKIGVACSVESPRERMDIREVIDELHSIRDNVIGTEMQGEMHEETLVSTGS